MFKSVIDFAKMKYQILIPVFSIIFWSFYVLVHENFFLDILETLRYDFLPLYDAGKQVFVNPSSLYETDGYFYLPSFAIVYGILFSWQPTYLVWYVHYAFIFILAILCLLEFDKILINLKVEEKSYRFLLNTLFMFGWTIYNVFYLNQAKFIVVLSFLFVLRRELVFKIENREKTFKFYLLNYSLLIFSLSIMPFLIFLVIIYVFHDIQVKDLFRKYNLKKYLIFIILFLIQNIFFIIFPNLILSFIDKGIKHSKDFTNLLLIHKLPLDFALNNIVKLMSTVILGILTLFFIMFKNDLSLEVKFGYFSFFYLFLNVWKGYSLLILNIPLILILLIPYVKNIEVKRIYKDKFLLFAILAILIIQLEPTYNETIFNIFPFTSEYPFIIFIYLRWAIPILILTFSFTFLKIKKKNNFY